MIADTRSRFCSTLTKALASGEILSANLMVSAITLTITELIQI